MLLNKGASAVVVVIVNLFALAVCAAEDDGKLIFAHVVSLAVALFEAIWIFKFPFPVRYLDMVIEPQLNLTQKILGKTRNGGLLALDSSQM